MKSMRPIYKYRKMSRSRTCPTIATRPTLPRLKIELRILTRSNRSIENRNTIRPRNRYVQTTTYLTRHKTIYQNAITTILATRVILVNDPRD
jgi:hypothetical protein